MRRRRGLEEEDGIGDWEGRERREGKNRRREEYSIRYNNNNNII